MLPLKPTVLGSNPGRTSRINELFKNLYTFFFKCHWQGVGKLVRKCACAEEEVPRRMCSPRLKRDREICETGVGTTWPAGGTPPAGQRDRIRWCSRILFQQRSPDWTIHKLMLGNMEPLWTYCNKITIHIRNIIYTKKCKRFTFSVNDISIILSLRWCQNLLVCGLNTSCARTT